MGALIRGWNRFFLARASPTPIALYRMCYGALTMATLLVMRGDWLTWFGPHGAVSSATVVIAMPPVVARASPAFSILSLLPQTDTAVIAFCWISLAAAFFLTIGFATRLNSVLVYACLVSMQARNPFIMNIGDWLLRVTGFFLVFAPAGAALSVDRLLRRWRGREGVAVAPRSPWAQRMLQIQVAVMYIATVWWKLLGHTWVNGTAVYYSLHKIEYQEFPLPGMDHLAVARLATWLTLLIEIAGGTLIWFRRFRYPVLAAMVSLHLGIAYTMHIPLFQWIVMSTFVTFVYPEDLTRTWGWLRARLSIFPRRARQRPAVAGIAGHI